MHKDFLNRFLIKDQVAIITGGAGLLGQKHAEAILEISGIPILFDINKYKLKKAVNKIFKNYKIKIDYFVGSVTKEKDIKSLLKFVKKKYKRLDILINNAANNSAPKIINNLRKSNNFSLKLWNKDLDVGLTGFFLCSKILGRYMEFFKKGVIINISSDLGLISPDQRIYKKGKKNYEKPISYSVIKHGVIGLNKYLSTYWANSNIRVNCLCPGGVYNFQDKFFVKKLSNLIPLSRMADADEYKAAIQFLSSKASSYMTGQNLVIDGGRTAW